MKNSAALTALFGSGQDGASNGGLISNVWIGGRGSQNTYTNIRTALTNLGIHNGTQASHHNHFHIDLRRPDRVGIPQNLLADNATADQTRAVSSEELRSAAQILFEQVQPQLNFEQGEVAMFVLDLPEVPEQYAPVVIAQAPQAKTSDKTDRTIGVCQLIENRPESIRSAINGLSPLRSVNSYFSTVENRELGIEGNVHLLQAPAHGTLEDEGNTYYGYHPSPDYYGQDSASFLVEIGSLKVKVMYFFNVLEGVADDMYEDTKFCPNGEVWKISFDENDPNAPVYTFEYPSQLTNPLTNAIKANLSIADLPFGALGQTTGTTITLDDNAAGFGWFIDSTPWSNEEYLPTHDPNVWVAKDGSGAVGKMDMLSVLLHEYGHALGIDHSADHSSYMATTLTPGTRRMPSACRSD